MNSVPAEPHGGPFDVVFAPAFTAWAAPITWIEIVACVLAVAMVVLNMRVDPRAWPLAIASSLLYFALFWHSRLYGDAALQLFFAAIAVWGWRLWTQRRTASRDPMPPVRALRPRERLWLGVGFALGWPAIGLFLRRFTDTDVPWWDAFPTALSVIGQWLLGRKIVANWPVWIVVNVVSVALFAYKGLWLTVLLYAVFVGMAIAGWRAWTRLLPAGRAPDERPAFPPLPPRGRRPG